ncbi:MAG: hypothetical protein FWC36_02840 [Spirochaetes bacterium]|nr:hypothetical protein [Spirochaetota bacterium]
MKNSFKFWGILALVALIGFSMAGCDNNGPGADPIPEGAAGWPPNSVLEQFGLGGKPEPGGATNIEWVSGPNSLRIDFRGPSATGYAVRNWFNLLANDWAYGTGSWTKDSFEAVLEYEYDQVGTDNFEYTLVVTRLGVV